MDSTALKRSRRDAPLLEHSRTPAAIVSLKERSNEANRARGSLTPLPAATKYTEQIDRFVSRLCSGLPVPPTDTRCAQPAYTRRYKARSLHTACGVQRMHVAVLGELAVHLQHKGVYTDRLLTSPASGLTTG